MAARTLAGMTALVTGASGGIGGAISQELARRGARVVLSGRNSARLSALQSQIPDSRVALCDLHDASSIRALGKSCPQVDILVNAAGLSRDSLVVRQRSKDLEDMLQVNLVSAMELCRHVAMGMIRRRSGCIINVSSVVGVHGNVGQSAYAASKAGLIGFTKALARELGPRGVRANVLAPGFIDTEMTRAVGEQAVTRALVDGIPLNTMGSVEDVAHGAAYLAEARYVTGQVLVIDGGLFV
ncbi:hypothetical protein LPJ63_001831 [Coemansia sp. RSA 2711]|nr:hypothetical protein LPJ63_001831 [Coemansia sp. RSA 2711]